MEVSPFYCTFIFKIVSYYLCSTTISYAALKFYSEKLLLLMRNLSERLRKINNKLGDVCRKIYEAENA